MGCLVVERHLATAGRPEQLLAPWAMVVVKWSVNVLAFYSDDPSSNPAEVYNFSLKLYLKRTKINKKRLELKSC